MRVDAGLVLFVVVFAAFSGCADGNKEAAPITTDPNALPEGVTNILRGQVTAIDETPLANATVVLPGTTENRTTNEAGEYQFESLEPRDYLVTVSKEGYLTRTQRAIIEDGKIYELHFRLEEKPLQAPYHDIFPYRGQISCQVAVATDPENVAYHNCGEADPNNAQRRDFGFQTLAAQIVVEAFWTPNTEASRELTMQVETVGLGTQDIVFGTVAGESGLKFPVSQSLLKRYYPDGGSVRVIMSAAPGLLNNPDNIDVGVSIQQAYQLYVTVFYVEPGDVNYSARPPS